MPASRPDDLTYKAAFLGPRGENADEMEQLLLDVLRDHVFWRRNFHPEDPRLIREQERNAPAFARTVAHLRDELFQILAKLKSAAPLHSPRQVAHIVSDPSLPALVGYFAGMLYNQNNVVQEVAPETVRREGEYVAALARMVGYPPTLGEQVGIGQETPTRRSFGHLCSGGTTANIEALWAARNVRFFPLALRLLLLESPAFGWLANATPDGTNPLEIATRDGSSLRVDQASTADLLNLPIPSVLDLHRKIKTALATPGGSSSRRARAQSFEEAPKTVQTLGMAAFLAAYNTKVAETERVTQLPAVLLPVTSHYCWKKAMDLVGLGSGPETLIEVGVDDRIRLSAEALEERLEVLANEGRPVLMVVSVCGTTEEGAVDPLHDIHRLGQDPALPAFWHHSDAAVGGFFASMLPRGDRGERRPFEQLSDGDRKQLGLDKDVYDAIGALGHADSITLDPHKFGYVPYPCGTILFRDYAVRDFIAHEAPYLAGDRDAGFGGFLGKWTLEGSRPGAAAVSCYLAQAVLPLNQDGHGQLIANCVRTTTALFEALRDRFQSDQSQLAFCPFNEAPDTTGFCFALVPRHEGVSLAELNAFTEHVWKTMTVNEEQLNVGEYAFLISKSEVAASKYPRVLERMFHDTPLAADMHHAALEGSDEQVRLLRVFVLNPFLSEWVEHTEHLDVQEAFDSAFSQHVDRVAHELLPSFLLERFVTRKEPGLRRRLRVLVVEDEQADADSILQTICYDRPFSRYLSARAIYSVEEARMQRREDWDKVVLDLQLDPDGQSLDLSGLRVASNLLKGGGGFTPDQFVVYSRFGGDDLVQAELQDLGIGLGQIIEKPKEGDPTQQDAKLRALLEQLVTGVLTPPGSADA
ncbi:MAG: pyridoxal-dependent decarboxylase [Bacteroidota bacterium]